MRLVVASFYCLAISACAAPDALAPVEQAAPMPAVEPREPQPAARPHPQRILQGPGELQVRGYLQDVVGDRYGRAAWTAFTAAPTAIAAASIAGRWATSHEASVGLLVRSREGWRVEGGSLLSRERGAALDSLLADPRLWAEPGRYPEVSCPDSGADVLMIRHRGRVKTVYQSGGCGTANLSTRLIQSAIEAAR